MRFESQMIYIYCIYTHPLDYSIVNTTFSQYCCSLLQIWGGFSPSGNIISEFWPEISQNDEEIVFYFAHLEISYLQNCGVFARSVTCGGAVGKLRLLYLSTSGLLQHQLISWIFFGVTPPKISHGSHENGPEWKDFIPALETILFWFHVSF